MALFLALFLGLASVFLPAWFVVSTMLVPAVLVLMLVRPEYALLAAVALVCDLVHPALVPRVPLLGGSISAADAALAMLTAYATWVFVAGAGKTRLAPIPGGRSLLVPGGLFGLSVVIGIALSLSVWQLSPAVVLGEARDLSYLLMLPITVIVLRQRERQDRFVRGLVILGCLFAFGQVLQGVFGLPVFGTSGISALETLGYREYSTIRTNTHGLSIIILALLLVLGAHVMGLIKGLKSLLLGGLLFLGIFLTFGHTTFAAVTLCGMVVVVWLNARTLPRLAGTLLLVLIVGAVLGSVWKPESFYAVYYRMTSISAEINYGYSAGWRFMEAESMLPHIVQHPLSGIGLGADYKGIRGSSAHPELNRYMHNAYLYMAGKLGLPALALFLIMMAGIFAIGRRLAQPGASPAVRVVAAASAATMVRFVFASITEPHLMTDHGVVSIAVAGAMVYLCARRAAQDAAPGSNAASQAHVEPGHSAVSNTPVRTAAWAVPPGRRTR